MMIHNGMNSAKNQNNIVLTVTDPDTI